MPSELGRRWRVSTALYVYEVRTPDGERVIAYHWHPLLEQREHPYPFPHLHIGDQAGPSLLAKRHLPTGRVSLEAVVRFLVDELAVEPIRPDWAAVLTSTEAEFHRRRSWIDWHEMG